MYKRCGKHPEESLFYTHMLSMPAFLFLASNIRDHVVLASQSPGTILPVVNLYIPSQFAYLVLNMLMHFICISSVYVLLTECTSLTVTLVVTLRKFISLIFSVWYFKNTFTLNHWLGTAFVFMGTVIFTELVPKIMSAYKESKLKAEFDERNLLLINDTSKSDIINNSQSPKKNLHYSDSD